MVENVKEIEAERLFYVDVRELKIEREHPTYVQFKTLAIAADEPMRGKTNLEVFLLVENGNESF